MFQRKLATELLKRITEPRKRIQIVLGPRQTGKTTAVGQAIHSAGIRSHFVSADDPQMLSGEWIRNAWNYGRTLAAEEEAKGSSDGALLVIDEIQKVDQWSAYVKLLWDEDVRTKVNLKVILTGSSSLLLAKGMADSLMGRFEVLQSTHWSFQECEDAFGYTFDDYLLFGGFPGASDYVDDYDRWASYMGNSIIEPSISQDILQLEQVRKPALLRALFMLGASYSGQELSLTKVLGQMQDAGNTITLAHYLELLNSAGMLCGLQKYSLGAVRTRKSSPRFMAYDPSFMVFTAGATRETLESDLAWRGHLVESAVGAYLLARSKVDNFEVYYWRNQGAEVDFVIKKGQSVTAIEVKSGRVKGVGGSLEFLKRNPDAFSYVLGSQPFPIEDFIRGKFPLFPK